MERRARPITICLRCLVAYTDHESGECDDCLEATETEVALIRAASLLSKTTQAKEEKIQ